MKKGEFTDLSVDKVSLVGSPANKRSFLLFKGSKGNKKRRDNKVKKSLIAKAVELLKKHKGDLKAFVVDFRKFYKEDSGGEDLSNDDLKAATKEALDQMTDDDLNKGDKPSDPPAPAEPAAKSDVEIPEAAIKAAAKLIKDNDIKDVDGFKKEIKKDIYASLYFSFSDEDAERLFAAAASVVEKSGDDNTNDNPEGGDDVTKREKELQKKEEELQKKLDKLDAALERTEKLEKKLQKQSQSSDLDEAKKWLKKNAPYAGVDVDEAASDLVAARKVSEEMGKSYEAMLKRLSKANSGDNFSTSGHSGDGGGLRFRRDKNAGGRHLSKRLDKVFKDATTAVRKSARDGKDRVSLLRSIDDAMDDDSNREAYYLYRQRHHNNTKGMGIVHDTN